MFESMPFISNETFQQIFQSSVEAIMLVDQQGRILLANPVTERMFGYEKGAMIGLLVEDLLPEQMRAKHVGYRKNFTDHPEPRPMGMGRDLIAKRKDGSQFPVAVSLSYTNVDGQILVMAFISDITERKKAEEALKRSEEQLLVYASELEKKVQSRTEDLASTITALEKEVQVRKKAEEEARKALDRERELNELKSKFVSIASHEFRTPLSTVMSSASLISQYTEKGEPDKVNKHVLRIKSSVNHLTSILNDLLSLGKLEEGKVDVNKESIQLSEFLKEVKEEITSTLKAGQRLEVRIGNAVEYLSSDARILRNILFNLISNASKYSDENKAIHIECFMDGGNVAFAVRDEGIGIPAEDQKHMFDRFFRASNAGNVQGTGLGLNIVKRYVDLLNGTISFSSVHGKGSIFTVIIPTR
ncbi:PAS domain-containing sensor histidine kinase [Fulvivirgaceae bacterium PWU4]|uniref:histidine kinase n=1 Tax=Chryseosolibacter histidini TaxID=2782349 RepID=A0AAP2DGA2_9BACT|nr:PAS domain-containing sensor histidine kinase [Chryseosolibacter histidini]MBT1695868.1 PAS domain-containing sensor histidine kinase [Chryseosolibacter histidini]